MSEDSRNDHSKRHPAYIAYQVRDGKEGRKGRWTEIGAAWVFIFPQPGAALGRGVRRGR